MLWTETTRAQYRRESLRYASDLTYAKWSLVAAHLPACAPVGRPREVELRDVVDAILYIASTGCQWRHLPKDFPPYSTVQGYFKRRSVRFRRRQEDQGPQAAHRHRHAGPSDRRRHPCRRHPGPRRRPARLVFDPLDLSLVAPRLRRGRLCRPQTRAGSCWTRRLGRRNRQSPECGERFRTHRAPMGGRANLRLARPLPPRQRVRSHDRSALAWIFVAHIRRLTRKLTRP
jgi:transposase